MDDIELQHILTQILYSVVNKVKIASSMKDALTSECLESVYRLAQKHDLAHFLAGFVYDNQIEIDTQLSARLQRDAYISVYRCEQMKCALSEICSAFDDANIAYIPLKGSVIRPYYPSDYMRTSCDIDILIHETDLDAAIGTLESRGYRCAERLYHDVSLYSPNKVHLELHFSLQENMDNLDKVLKDVWQYAELSAGSQYALKEAFFVFHMYAHMAYHFLSGGCGIRSLLDIWVMEHKMGASYSCAEALLKKAGIYQFAAEMSRLSDQCFAENDRDAFSDLVLKYIYSGNVFGSAENSIAVAKSRNNSSVVYALKRLFLPYKSMVLSYPILKKAPYLLPFCWVLRWITVIFGGKTMRIVTELSSVNNMSDEKIAEVKEICTRLGLL